MGTNSVIKKFIKINHFDTTNIIEIPSKILDRECSFVATFSYTFFIGNTSISKIYRWKISAVDKSHHKLHLFKKKFISIYIWNLDILNDFGSTSETIP